MFLEELNLTEGVSSHKIDFSRASAISDAVVETSSELIIERGESKPKMIKMHSGLLPTALMMGQFLVSSRSGYGLWPVAEPIILPLVYDTGRIVFYLNASSCVYKMCNSDSKGAIKQFKNVSLGYALLLSIDAIMYLIEYYVDGVKENAISAIGMGVLGL